MDVSLELAGLSELTTDLESARAKVRAGAKAVTARGALNVKKGMQADFSGHPHAPAFPNSITYDVAVRANGDVEAEIGPDKKRRQGALGNILAFGTSKNAPVADITASLRREEPNFVKYLGELGAESLG